MKITINFAYPAGRLMPYLAGIFLVLGMIALVATFTLFLSGRQNLSEIPDLEKRLSLNREREIGRPVDLLTHDKLVELRSRVKILNTLTSTTGQTLPILLSRLERLMPDGVWLVTLQYRSQDDEAKLLAEASRAEQLTDFMGQLERSGFFSQVLLTHQSQRAGDARAVQFEIQLRGKP